MSKDINREILLHNILVAIDTSSHSRAALKAAAALAKIMEARIHGLFVQDEIWSKISRIPSSSTINELTGTIRPLKQKKLEHQIEMLEKRLRRRLETISRKNKIKHSWESVRGIVEEKILEAAEEADLITIGRRGSSFPGRRRLGSSAKAVIQKSDKPVLILKQGLELGSKITILYDASAESQRGMRLALSLAQKNDSPITILVADNNSKALKERDKELENTLEEVSISTTVKLLEHTDTWSFLNSVRNLNSDLLVISKNQPVIRDNLEIVLNNLNCPILLIP